MSSIVRITKGDRLVSLAIEVYGSGRVRVGKNKRAAELVKRHIDELESAQKLAIPLSADTRKWVDSIEPKLRKRLEVIGLLADDVKTVGDLVAAAEKRNRGKLTTCRNRTNAFECIEHFFGAETNLRRITEDDAEEFKYWHTSAGRRNRRGEFTGEPMSEATTARRVKRARKFFRLAMSLKWIEFNPFFNVKSGSQVNDSRAFFIDKELFEAVYDELPTWQTKAAFALARWGGLRSPSELVPFKWSNVDWARDAMRFRTVKTEHHKGKETRFCPLFAELYPYLREAFEAAEPGAEYVFTDFRDLENPGVYLRTRIEKALELLNLPMWPKLLVNLRASRATEIYHLCSPKDESDWIGHGEVIAMKHYIQSAAPGGERWAKATGKKVSTAPESSIAKLEKLKKMIAQKSEEVES